MHTPSNTLSFPFVFCNFFQNSQMQKERSEHHLKVKKFGSLVLVFKCLNRGVVGNKWICRKNPLRMQKYVLYNRILSIHFKTLSMLEIQLSECVLNCACSS